MELEYIRLSRPVKEALHNANMEFLSEEVKSNELFQWINQYSVTIENANNFDQKYDNQNEWINDTISRLIYNTNKVCLNYYLTSIYLIGRLMKVSTQKKASLQEALYEPNLENTLNYSIDELFKNKSFNKFYTTEKSKTDYLPHLKRVLINIFEIEKYNNDLARDLWGYWKYEMNNYKKVLEEVKFISEWHSLNNYSLGEKYHLVNSIIELTSYEFMKLPLYKTLKGNGFISEASYDDIFAENLFLFTGILHYIFPPYESNDYKEMNQKLYKQYYSRLSKGIIKLNRIKKIDSFYKNI